MIFCIIYWIRRVVKFEVKKIKRIIIWNGESTSHTREMLVLPAKKKGGEMLVFTASLNYQHAVQNHVEPILKQAARVLVEVNLKIIITDEKICAQAGGLLRRSDYLGPINCWWVQTFSSGRATRSISDTSSQVQIGPCLVLLAKIF